MCQSKCKWYPFLQAVRGNWRNALFINCSNCPYRQQPCPGFFLAADAEGKPLIVPVGAFQEITGQKIEPEECHGSLSRQVFEDAFSLYLEWYTASTEKCPLWQLCNESMQCCIAANDRDDCC